MFLRKNYSEFLSYDFAMKIAWNLCLFCKKSYWKFRLIFCFFTPWLISRKITTHRLFPLWWTRLTWSLKTSFRGNLMWHFEHGVHASFCITFGWLTLIWATRCWASENSQLHAEHLTKKVDSYWFFLKEFGKIRENLLEKLDQNFFGAWFDFDLNDIIV